MSRESIVEAMAPKFPRWHLWAGVTPPGLYYARLPNTSPPIVVSAPTIRGLCDELERAEQLLDQGKRP